MRRAQRAGLALALVAAVGASVVAHSEPTDFDAVVTTDFEPAVTKAFPVYNTAGKKIRTQQWRLTKTGGNCCEVLVSTTATGRLLEFGGSYVRYSDDRAKTWKKVAPITPLYNGEGAVVPAPGGDVVGIGWDPYTGDHLQSFKYTAKTKKWQYAETPLHAPLYDRPWVVVAKGPFTIDGETVPWVSVVLSGYVAWNDLALISTDGLNYRPPTTRMLDSLRGALPVSRWLEPQRDADLDYIQPQTRAHLTPLAGGGLLGNNSGALDSGCSTGLLGRNGAWSCYTAPNGETYADSRLLVDSRGWLHRVTPGASNLVAGELEYSVSTNGGRSWSSTTIAPLRGVIEQYDFKVHAKSGVAALVAHVKQNDPALERDVVFKLDIRRAKPRVSELLYVGDGDGVFTAGLAGGATRFDFVSVAILPDGKLVASFADKTYADPALAVQL